MPEETAYLKQRLEEMETLATAKFTKLEQQLQETKIAALQQENFALKQQNAALEQQNEIAELKRKLKKNEQRLEEVKTLVVELKKQLEETKTQAAFGVIPSSAR